MLSFTLGPHRITTCFCSEFSQWMSLKACFLQLLFWAAMTSLYHCSNFWFSLFARQENFDLSHCYCSNFDISFIFTILIPFKQAYWSFTWHSCYNFYFALLFITLIVWEIAMKKMKERSKASNWIITIFL